MADKPGTVPKDASITPNLHKGLSARATREAKREAKRQKDRELRPGSLDNLLAGAIADAEAESASQSKTKANTETTDAKAADKMLEDLRYAYRNAVGPSGKKGRLRLLDLMQADSEFKNMVKLLISVETAIKKAEIAKVQDPGQTANQNFFVVLKGLESEKSMLQLAGVKDNTVDMKQIQHAISPDETGEYEAEEVSRFGAPEQLMRGNCRDEEEDQEIETEKLSEGVGGWLE